MRIESDTNSDAGDDRSLNRLLAQARWPAADEAAMAGLRATLASQSLRIAAKQARWRKIAIAASVGIALIGGTILMSQRRNPQPIATRQAAPAPLVAVSAPHAVPPIIARPANEYECAVLLANSSRHPAPAAAPAIAARPPVNPPAQIAASIPKIDPRVLVNRALDSKANSDARSAICSQLLAQNNLAAIDGYLQLVQNASTRDAALDALRSADHPPTQLLLAQLNAPLVSRRYAAARALGCLCHGPTFEALVQRVERNIDRREAMIALLYCPNPAAKEYLNQLRSRPALEMQLQAVRSDIQTTF